jgi:hypothetical protein
MSHSPSPEPDTAKAWIVAAIIWLAVVFSLTTGPAEGPQALQLARAQTCP